MNFGARRKIWRLGETFKNGEQRTAFLEYIGGSWVSLPESSEEGAAPLLWGS